MKPDNVPRSWAMSAVVATYLRARRLPQRLAAIAVTALLGATIARAPAPAVRVDLEAASYPAVLVGVLVPVLIGVLAAAPARLVGAAVQNALITLFAAVVLALVIGSGVATAVAGAAAVVMLFASPRLAGEPWVVVDTQADIVDWLLLVVLAMAATAVMLRTSSVGLRNRCSA